MDDQKNFMCSRLLSGPSWWNHKYHTSIVKLNQSKDGAIRVALSYFLKMQKLSIIITLSLLLANCETQVEIPTVVIQNNPTLNNFDFQELGASGLVFGNDRYYFISSNNKAVIITDQYFNTLKVCDTIGYGPGEFQRVNSVSSDGKNLFVHDSGKHTIEIFDYNFKFKSSKTLERRVSSIATPNKETIFATVFEPDSWEFIEMRGADYNRTKVHYIESTKDMSEGICRLAVFDNLLLISRPLTNKYSIFDMNTGKISHFTNQHLPSEPVFRTMGNVKLPEKPVWRNGWIHANHVYQFYIGDDEKRYIYANDMSGTTIKRFLLEGDEGFIYYRESSLISISADKIVEYPITHFEIL